ncbi:YueI family protein [Bacillus sp. F19]|nr:YueI family protein [Bacillus sp. F19]
MSNDQIDLYIKQGIYGAFETKPEERHVYLGSLRERICVALTVGQVRQNKIYNEVLAALETRKNKALFLNGKIEYGALSKYIKAANKEKIPFTIVSDQNDTKIGLIVASDHAIDHKEIYVKDKIFEQTFK